MTRVLLAEDHIMVAEGLAALLRTAFELIDVVHDGRCLVQQAEAQKPDVIIADYSMPSLNGLDAAERILHQNPKSNIILLSMYSETGLAVRALRAGVKGFILKTAPADNLLDAVRQVASGHQYLTPSIAGDVMEQLVVRERKREVNSPLTARQREVLQLIGEGYTMRGIAEALHISPRTAESHKYEIMRQLGATTTAELIRHAVHLQLVQPLGRPDTCEV